jgi:putative YpdA family bacillithiol system oxidoreductase
MESMITYIIFGILVAVVFIPHWRKSLKHKREAMRTLEKNEKAGMLAPVTLHPKINVLTCIGCASCVRVCPEHVLGIVNGRASIVSGLKCIGHGVCVEVCPVGAITLGFGTPRAGMEIPYYDENYQSNVGGLYIVGELGGIGLIKNAVGQGLKAMEDVLHRRRPRPANGYDVVIVGCGPAGIAAALACQANNLKYVVLEQDEIGGTVLHYPRQKLVLTSPVDLPLYGRLKISEISKEELLEIWKDIVSRFKLNILTKHKVDAVEPGEGGLTVRSGTETYTAASVFLAIGRRGSPRKLNVPGENLPKVMYRLIDAESYKNKHLLVVGGGDSAVEAAVGLASQRGNVVTISYRREEFVRLKEKNEQRVGEFIKSGKIKAVFNSGVSAIKPDAVVLQEANNILHNLQNDFVFVFAGGEMPTELLKKAGVKLRESEVVTKAKAEAA